MCRCGCPRPGTAGGGGGEEQEKNRERGGSQRPGIRLPVAIITVSQLRGGILEGVFLVGNLGELVCVIQGGLFAVIGAFQELVDTSGNAFVLGQDTDLPLGVQSADIGDIGGLLGLGQSAVEHGDSDGHQNSDDGDNDQHLHQGEALFVVEFFQHG